MEFHILAIFLAKELLNSVAKKIIEEPLIIKKYCQMAANCMDAYNKYIFIMGIILIIVGISGVFFKLIPVLNKYKIVYAYSDFGFYAGCWLLLIFFTYYIYISMGKAFLAAPVIAYILYLLEKNVWLESNGIIFGE